MESQAPYSKLAETTHHQLGVPPAKLEKTKGEKAMEPSNGASMTCGMYLLVCIASVGGFLFGYDTGVISGAMIEIKQGSGIGGRTLTAEEQELVVSCTVAAAAVGSGLSGMLQQTRYFGRKTLILNASILFIHAAWLMALANSVTELLVGRVLVGLSVGVASHTVPIYIAEAAPAHMRGTLATMNNVTLVLGQVIASATCCLYAQQDYETRGRTGWRWMIGWGAAPAIALFLGACCLPESPRWLLHVAENRDKAKASILWLRRDVAVANEELHSIEVSIAAEMAAQDGNTHSLLQKLCARRTRRALVLGMGLQILQQATGINTIMYYSATIMEMARSTGNGSVACHGSQSASSHLTKGDVGDVCWTAPLAMCQLAGTIVGMLAVDRWGRRPLVLSSLLAAAASLFSLGLGFHGDGHGELASVAMCTYLTFFGLGLAPVPWLVNAEIFPLETRGAAIGLTTATNWIANFFVAATFLDVSRALSTDKECPETHPDGGFWLYGIIAILGFVWLAVSMPETKGLTLEEIDRHFD
mmetsp:Transcript_36303/g.66510  ORF Transcript_36303/g.66510 Transcript_36303/m.66510 type:complete len:530 (-) Transcript_36303:112-1701(-)